MEERRRFLRLEKPMAVRQYPEDSDIVEHTESQNISTGGMRITTDAEFDVGSRLNMEINIAGLSKPYYAAGEVVWLREKQDAEDKKFDLGIRFVRVFTNQEFQKFE